MKQTVIGVDIGGTNLRIACVDRTGGIKSPLVCSSKILVDADDSITKTAEVLAGYIKNNAVGDIEAVSIGFPGAISKDRQTTLSVPNLQNGEKGFDGRNVVVPLQEYLKLPVFINKDANNLLQCDIRLRNLYSKGITTGFYFGTGIGNSIFINGNFVFGRHGVATDIGHIPVFKSEKICNCGNTGCIECYASGSYLREMWKSNLPNIPFSKIFKLCAHEQLIADFIDACAVTVATELNILDPDLVIIGGGVVDMEDFPMNLLEERIRFHCRKPYPAQGVVITTPIISKDTGVIGAAFYAYDLIDGIRRGAI
jgi:allose kinase